MVILSTSLTVCQDRFQQGRLANTPLPHKVDEMCSSPPDAALDILDEVATTHERDTTGTRKVY
jgi:hypothetical protein